jgi:hypothetical protein
MLRTTVINTYVQRKQVENHCHKHVYVFLKVNKLFEELTIKVDAKKSPFCHYTNFRSVGNTV